MDHPNDSQASFITAKDWTLEHLLATGAKFRTVERVSAKSKTPEQIASIIQDYEQRDVPLVVQDLHCHPDWPEFFTTQWLERHYGPKEVEVRNVHGERLDRKSTVTELIESWRKAPSFAHQGERERLYGKDMRCPSEWGNWIKTSGVLPNVVIPGATGDILPETVETLMSYLGISDTFTPLHKDSCASYGHNIMCHTEEEGRSFWFMTNPSDCGVVSGHFQKLGHELDWEDHAATLEELAGAPFDVYVLEQKLGDLVLVPPRCFHQVVNAGGITIKISWSRMLIRSLEIALYHELPLYRRVCRPEVYRVKQTIYETLIQRTVALDKWVHTIPDVASSSANPLCQEVARLIELLDDVLEQEFCTHHRRLRQPANSPAPDRHNYVCDFCGADIFLSFFQCDSCSSRDGPGDPVCLCPTCVVEGRACKCKSMNPIQNGTFRELLHNRNNATFKLRQAREAGLYEEEPEVLSDQHLIDSVRTTFQAALLLRDKRRDILNSPKTTRTCTLARKGLKSHVVDGWAIIMCKECHAGKCFVHILEAGIHSSEAVMTVEHDKKCGKWHSTHTSRQKSYEDVLPGLIRATKKGEKTEIDHRLAYFAQTFQTPRPLSRWVSLGFYDKEQPDLEEVDQLDSISVAKASRVKEGTEPPPSGLNSNSPTVATITGAPSRKRKRSSGPSSIKPDPDLPSQPLANERSNGPPPQTSQSSERYRMECVLIETPPPGRRKKAAPEKLPGDEDESPRTRTKKRDKGKQWGKKREGPSISKASMPPDPQSPADEPMRSRSHSVSSLRPPLFEPETGSPLDDTNTDPVGVEEYPVKVEPEAIDDSDEEAPVPLVSHKRQRIETESPPSTVEPPPPSSPGSSPHPEEGELPYYTAIRVIPRPPGSGIRIAPDQRQIARTPASMYNLQVPRAVAGPSNPVTRIGPPKRRLPDQSGPKLRHPTEVAPPRPPPPHPGLAALQAKMNSIMDENQKIREELATVKSELAATRDDRTAALTRIEAMERSFGGLEELRTKQEEMKNDYEKLSSLLSNENLFDSERFRMNVQAVVKNSFGYYFPSLKNELKNQLGKELSPAVKEYVENEMGKVVDEVVQVRAELVTLQKSSVSGITQSGDPMIVDLKQAIERVDKKQEELEAMFLRAEGTQSNVPTITPNDTRDIHPPHLPSKPPSPSQDNRQRGAQTPPVAFDQNSYPFQQGLNDKVVGPSQMNPTRDPRLDATLSLSSPTLPPRPTSLLHSESNLTKSTPIDPPPKSPSPSTSALLSSMHPSRVARLGTNAFNPPIKNTPEPQAMVTDSASKLQRLLTRSVFTSHPESAPTIPAQLPIGMHPDRIALLSAHDRSSSAIASTRPSPGTILDESQPRQPLEKRLITGPRSFLSGANATVLQRNGPIPSSSRVTLDDPITSELHRPGPSISSFDRNWSPDQNRNGITPQKRNASEALLPPEPPKRPRKQRNTRGIPRRAAAPIRKRMKSKKKKKAKIVDQPEASNPRLRIHSVGDRKDNDIGGESGGEEGEVKAQGDWEDGGADWGDVAD